MKHHSILLVSAAVLGLLPLSLHAATETVDGVKWEYKIESGAAVVIGVQSEKAALVIPDVLGEAPVYSVDANSFSGNETAVTIAIPEGVKRIGNRAFEKCAALESIAIPGSVTNIGKRAFAGCEQLASAVIGDGVAALPAGMFADCIRLSSIVFPPSLKTIGEEAFLNCRALVSVDLGSTETIGDNAFLGCGGLQGVVFPATLRHIGASAFADCFELVSVSIPETVEAIDPGAFSGCYLLEYALLPTAFKETYASFGFPGRCVIRFWDAPDALGSYTVTFDANGGTGTMSDQTLDYGHSGALPPNAFTRSKYVFAGWSTSATGPIMFADGGEVSNLEPVGDTVTLYARWAKATYKVKFCANGGTGKMAKQAMTYGVSKKLSANKFKRSGYVFGGWSKTKAGPAAYKNKKKVKNLTMTGKTVKLYAQWGKKKYKVVFRSNDGNARKATQSLTYGKSATLRRNTFEYLGCRFLGWATAPDGDVVYADGASVTNLRADGKSFTLYAVWGGASEADEEENEEDVSPNPVSSGVDEVDFSLLQWKFGGFGGGSAQIASKPRISSLSVSDSGMSYAWVSGGCEDLGASSAGDASCLACLFCLIDGQWVGGKFDWISTSRRTRDFKNIHDSYNGWPSDAISKGEAFAFVIVSKNGRERTNVIRCDK